MISTFFIPYPLRWKTDCRIIVVYLILYLVLMLFVFHYYYTNSKSPYFSLDVYMYYQSMLIFSKANENVIGLCVVVHRKQALLKQKEYLKKRKQKKQARLQEMDGEREKEKKKWLNFSVRQLSTYVINYPSFY